MVELTHDQAILFRVLVAFFGEDQVIPHMTVAAVCGGNLSPDLDREVAESIQHSFHMSAAEWARASRCLFTIVNRQDLPRLVVEFGAQMAETVDVKELERQRFLRPVLEAAGITYVTMSQEEFLEIANPASKFDLYAFLKSRFEYSEAEL